MFFWKNNQSPITPEDQDWLEKSFIKLSTLFDRTVILEKERVLPNNDFFDWHFTGEISDAEKSLALVCNQMDVELSNVNLSFYSEEEVQFTDEGLLAIPQKDDKRTAGKYYQERDGKYEVLLEIQQLKSPVDMIATLAHEVAHIKLLGENRIILNDEPLTDLVTHIYGFGIFSSNSSVVKMNTWSGNSHTGWRISGAKGYLHTKIHAFAMALFSLIREESDLDWLNYCEKDIEKEFKKSVRYLKTQDLSSFIEKVRNPPVQKKPKDLKQVRLKKRNK
ncbi:hypothetical protein [Chondrinema litorale]|uniref:hypothetical protein n=1 Tax=Chondrinema litorale TaxID=2994555 RepID=UPI002543B593|nr:hypothetical protein [Chondrinema litorale]UZR99536.1 hypothetical protein OQ292_36705 [Chondrinema litorale]